MSYNKQKSLVANVEAIETAMKVKVQRRRATDKEKETLSLYSGFGGIKEVLNMGTDKPIAEDMAEPIGKLQRLIDEYPYFTDTMRQQVVSSIKASVLTAFYTPQFIVDAVAQQIQKVFAENGLTMRTFLEPSAGIGGFLPVAMPDTDTHAFEKDHLTGLVLSVLHDEAQTYTAGFETIDSIITENRTFDVIASNIPFGNFRVFDAELWKKGGIYEQATKTIHNYFFVKSMELLNEGGLLAFVTSRGVADTPGNKFVREYLVRHANLITALRLPDTLFMQTGGIEVGSDLLVFQKNTHKSALSGREQAFLQVSKEMVDMSGKTTEYANRLFTMPKTTLATGSRIAMNQYGKYVRKYLWESGEVSMFKYLSGMLQGDFEQYFRKGILANGGSQPMQMSLFGDMDCDTDVARQRGKRAYTDDTEDWMKNGALVMFEGQVGTLQYRKSSHYTATAVDFMPVDDGKVNIERARDYFPIRKTYFELSNIEREEQREEKALREQLNREYDAFVSKWGFFHDNDNREFIMLDSLGVEVFTIEMQVSTDIFKADIMREPVAFQKDAAEKVLTSTEALLNSLNYYGIVNMSYMSQSTGKSEDNIAAELKGEIFYNPTVSRWEHKGMFLAGNVIAKSKEIISCIANLDGKEKVYAEEALKALEDVCPEPVPYEELDINMGERWIDTKLYAAFASELFDVETSVMYFDVNDTYLVRLQGYSGAAADVRGKLTKDTTHTKQEECVIRHTV